MPAEQGEHDRSAVAVQPVICWPAAQPDEHVLAHADDVVVPYVEVVVPALKVPGPQPVQVRSAVVVAACA